ncbi:hypothetical protein Q3G72_008716 [Acer saccharum]|nr:hypothetical protein Q3G72_008716 [Acer saccharum]
MQNLEYLDLSSNDLIGSIPKSFEKLTFLSKYSVAYIHLRGEIPTGGQFYTFPASSFEDHKIDVQYLEIFCKCKLKSGDEYEDVCAGTLDAFADLRHGTHYIGSDDLVYMGFDNRMYPLDIGDNNEASIQFYIGPHYNGKRREDCKLKKCGVRLMYVQDHREFNGSFSSVKEEDKTRPHQEIEINLISLRENPTDQFKSLTRKVFNIDRRTMQCYGGRIHILFTTTVRVMVATASNSRKRRERKTLMLKKKKKENREQMVSKEDRVSYKLNHEQYHN